MMGVSRRAIISAVGAFALTFSLQVGQAEVLAREVVRETPLRHITDDEMNDFVMAVKRCWNVGSLPTEALRVKVTVGVSLDLNGKPDRESLKMTAFEGGSEALAQQAFVVARRAIIRCGVDGYDLPADKYEVRKDLSIVFDTKGLVLQ